MIDNARRADLAGAMTQLSVAAGALALEFFEDGGATSAAISYKAGGSPVSEADVAADTFLKQRLRPLLPGAGWLSEETADDSDRLDKSSLFIVDPIDGTRAFIKGDPRWGVSVALVEDGRPVIGIIHMPALRETFCATLDGGAWLNGQKITPGTEKIFSRVSVGGPKKVLNILTGAGLDISMPDRVPSLAYRFALVAAGQLDVALASTNAWDWDIAAADLIVHESGGRLTGLDGALPRYNQSRPRHGALAAAGANLHAPVIAALNTHLPRSNNGQ